MRHLSLLLCLSASCAYAVPVDTPADPANDLTQPQIRSSVQTHAPEPPQTTVENSVSMTSEEFLQHPDLLQNALDTAIVQQNPDSIRFLLPLYRRLPKDARDHTLGKYAQGILLDEDGKYDEAEHIFRELLASHPDYAPIRLQLARTLAKTGQNREAAHEVSELRQTPDLPQEAAAYFDAFDQYLKNKRAWKFDGSLTYLQDDNVGRAPEQRTYGNWTFDEPKSAHGIGYEASAQKTVPVKNHWAARISASAYGKFYWDAHDYDDLNTRIEAGAVWRDAKQEIAVLPFAGKRWYGTEPYSRNSGGTLRYSRILSPKWQMFQAWQSGYKTHDKREYLDGATHNGSLSLLYRATSKQFYIFGIGGGASNAKDPSEAYRQANARISWHQAWGDNGNFRTDLSAAVQKRHYRAPDLFNIKRRDTEYSTRLTLAHHKLAWKGLAPRLNWEWSRTDSNHFYYRHNQNRVFLDIAKQF